MNSRKIKNILANSLPPTVYSLLKNIYLGSIKRVYKSLDDWYERSKIRKVEKVHEKLLEQLRTKDKIKVAFLFLIADSWKYDSLYREFEKDNKFEPIVIICPLVNQDQELILNDLNRSESFCLQKKYNYYVGYSVKDNKPIDLKTIIKPDIVFFSNPNKITTKEYLIDNYPDTLTCYVPYTFQIDALYHYRFNNRLALNCWKVFYETDLHKNYAEKYAVNRGKNVVVTGHPFLNIFKDNTGIDPWKKNDKKNLKRIIWGPHWTVKGGQLTGLNFSCFLEYADYFLELAEDYKNHVQFAFKPHPFLKLILKKPNIWGEHKTEEYYKKWDELPNTQLLEGEFVQLFKFSDALIHDSSAFLAEYHLLDKPSAYTIFDNEVFKTLNDFGINSLKVHTQIKSKNDLKLFIDDVVNEIDRKKQERNTFVKNFYFKNQHTASQNIVGHINEQLKYD